MSNLPLVSYDENAASAFSNENKKENAANAIESYKAFEIGTRRLRRILLYDSQNHLVGMPNYSFLVDGFSTSPKYFWLVYSTMAYCIKGRNLPGDLLTLFADDRVKALRCFNAARHATLAADEILIETITRHNLKDFTVQQMKDAENGE